MSGADKMALRWRPCASVLLLVPCHNRQISSVQMWVPQPNAIECTFGHYPSHGRIDGQTNVYFASNYRTLALLVLDVEAGRCWYGCILFVGIAVWLVGFACVFVCFSSLFAV